MGVSLICASSVALAKKHAASSVIYGDDGRYDVFDQRNDPRMRQLSRSTAVLIHQQDIENSAGEIVLNRDGSTTDPSSQNYRVKSRTFGKTFKLCPDETFYKQPVAGACSSFLVGPNLMVTAGHCIRNEFECKRARFVFDYAYTESSPESDPTVVKGDRIYSCARIVKSILDPDNGNDFSVIELDRAVEGREPLQMNRHDRIENETELTVIGNPLGLPTKIAAGGKVRVNDRKNDFSANLDTFQGSSGSAVFNNETGAVEGMLVRGEDDFVLDEDHGCRRVKRCADNECLGETVIRASEFEPYIP